MDRLPLSVRVFGQEKKKGLWDGGKRAAFSKAVWAMRAVRGPPCRPLPQARCHAAAASVRLGAGGVVGVACRSRSIGDT